MQISSPFDSLQMPKELACEFFAVFSRFEYALKEVGFLYVNRYGRASPNWGAFTKSATLQLNPELAQAIDFLNAEPPQIQTSVHNWKPVPLRGATSVAKALDATQRVRHNLFHGGKHTPHSPPGRDEALVRAALTVLLGCISQNKGLQAAYA